MFDKLFSGTMSKEITMETPVPDFIPYACHYTPETILTKNGELLQTVKITGFSRESIGSEKLDMRSVLRRAISSSIKSDDFAIWINTVRTKKNLDPGGNFKEGFSKSLNESWKKKNDFEHVYVNEVYVTILRDGKNIKLTDPKDMVSSLYFKLLRKNHDSFLAKAEKELTKVVNKMLKMLDDFGAKRLGIYEQSGVCYSEPMQFFSKILNLAEASYPMPVCDISEYISNHGIAVGFNTMEIKGATGKHFGMLFTIKEYHEISPEPLDKLLQLPQEFIITQTLDFINCKTALKEFKKQKYLLNISGDSELSQAIGLDDVIKSDDGSNTAFGDSQITLFLVNDSLKGLEEDSIRVDRAFSELGIVAARRDLRLEECFWSQMPGNFAYLTRKRPISKSLIGGFASLFNFPAGKRDYNHWGPAVTMFRTAIGTPYFFNFHVGNNGHTAIIGPYGTGKTVLLNFLVAQSRKFGGKLFFFDQNMASKVFINAIGGTYTSISPLEKADKYAINPMHMEDNKQNREFLKDWMVLLASSDGTIVTEPEKVHLEKLVGYLYRQPKEKRRLSLIAKSFGVVKKGSLGEKMAKWHGSGKYAHIFDNDMSNVLTLDKDIYGFDVSQLVKEGVPLAPVLSYLFHRIEMKLDGSPAVIVLDEAWKLVNNKYFAPKLSDWLRRLREKNAIVIFATETIPNNEQNEMTNAVTNSIATQIFLPNADAEESSSGYKNVWGLSDDEFEMLSRMRSDRRQFMMRQDDSAVVATLSFDGMRELQVLSGSDKTVKIMKDAIAEKGEDPKNWLPLFYERV